MNEDLYGLQASGIDPEIAAQMLGVKRRRDIALALQKQSMGGLSQTPTPAGGFAVRNHPLEAVAQIVQAYMANKSLSEADKEQAGLASENQRKVADAMSMYEQKRDGTQAQEIPDAGPGDAVETTTTLPGQAGNPQAAIRAGLSNPLIANSPVLKMDMQSVQPRVLGRTLVDATGKTLATDSTWAQEQKAAQEARQMAGREAMDFKEAEAQRNRDAAMERDRARADDRKAIAQLAGSLRQPAPPSYRDIIDPANPTQLITVDGKLYRPGGSIGSPGVIGVAGKEPTAARQENTKAEGKATVSDVVSTLRGYYDDLEKGGGIVDTGKNGAANAVSRLQSSGVGQVVGGVFGTKNQTARDGVAMTRPLLLAAVKNATGLTAKQLDSNADVKLWLTAATDPTKSVQANRSALNNILKYYGLDDAESSNFTAGKLRRASDNNADPLGIRKN